MPNDKPKKNNLPELMKFARELVPLNQEVISYYNDETYVHWGDNNLYPNYLINLFHLNSYHKGILSKKVDFITGIGAHSKESHGKLDYKVNQYDNIDQFLNKIIFDYVLFGGYTVEIQCNALGEAVALNHVPFQNVRPNSKLNKFWVCEDWHMLTNVLTYSRYGLESNGYSKIYYKTNYVPSVNQIYPIPEYSGAINHIHTHNLLGEMMELNIGNNFSLSTILHLYDVVADDQKRILLDKFKNQLSGVKGDNFVLDFVDGGSEKKLEVTTVPQSDNHELVNTYRNELIDNINAGHQISSPLLFGQKQEGQLGGNSELEQSYEIFLNSYVDAIRTELYSSLRPLFKECNFEMFELVNRPLFSKSIPEALKGKVMTVNEIRALENLPKLPDGDRIAEEVQPQQAFNLTLPADYPEYVKKKDDVPDLTNASEEEVKAVFKTDKPVKKTQLTDEDFELVKDLGIELNESKYTAKRMSQFAFKSFGIMDEIKSLLRVKKGNTLGSGTAGKAVEIMYKYEVRDNVPAAKGGSRPFCSKMMQLNRYYDRKMIQSISERTGIDTFVHAGGWYHNPLTGETTNYCRHRWVPYRVIKK